jgi:Kef-type K+ transport system membrane component KefB
MTAAVLDSIISLALVAILVPIATEDTAISMDGILLVLGKGVSFFVIVTLIGSWLFPTNVGFLQRIPILGNFSLRHILSMGRGEYMVLSLLLIAVLVALLAHKFGLHPAIGAYMAGLIIKRECFNFHQDQQIDFYKQARETIDNIAFSWIGPVFFVTLGTKLMFDLDIFQSVLQESLILFLGLFVGQILSAGLAARYIGKFDWSASWMIGFGMLGRAELAFVVMDIAYVQHKIMTTDAFYTLMITAFLLNCSVPLTIKWWKTRFKEATIKSR